MKGRSAQGCDCGAGGTRVELWCLTSPDEINAKPLVCMRSPHRPPLFCAPLRCPPLATQRTDMHDLLYSPQVLTSYCGGPSGRVIIFAFARATGIMIARFLEAEEAYVLEATQGRVWFSSQSVSTAMCCTTFARPEGSRHPAWCG